ncbi:hypothetical protein PIB30_098358 [Stylosanthes scabra]|uniref:Ubiquitin-like protease family profile domain-containing protein n=1 Tax=Stylosanthes scabra TaxID=79078 RepID=A0ABU6TX50_9FABA|nr:hypothetical protein [Stylosanthes scabra]
MDKVTLLSLANSIEQLSRQFQSLVQCLKDNHSSPSKVFKVFGSTSKTHNVLEVLQHSSEKAKTDLSIAKTGPRHIINQIDLPELELPILSTNKWFSYWVPIHFKQTTAMGLDYDELAIAAYLYGNTLMYNDEEELVISHGIRAHMDVFITLLPDTQIQDEVIILVAEMMTMEMTTESGYWFLPPSFAVFIQVSEMNKEGRKHCWYFVVVDRLARQVILLDPSPTKCQDRRRSTATKLVKTFSFYHHNNLFV